MKARGQPFNQAGFGTRQIDPGHTDLGESELTRPPSQLLHQLPPVDVMTLPHPPILETRDLAWRDEADCAAFALQLSGRSALRNAYVELRGELGAGKTTFVRHLLRALGVQGRIKSPTYAVLETYVLPGLAISHFDFYRFADPREWEDAGFREVFAAPGLKLAEWPQQAEAVLPAPDLRVELEIVDEQRRRVRLQALTPRGLELLP
jgi:tRNA threonylcarbamoyladenosine biosynthesis protein TsaE